MTRALLLLAALTASLSAQGTPRQTSEARFWLEVPAGQPPLREVIVSAGTATTAPWEKDPAVRERLHDVIFPVRWWDWRSMTVSFTPEADGTVDLVLNGPWEEEKPGSSFRKEVLWDDISAEGTTVQNGDFESWTTGRPEVFSGGTPEFWKMRYGRYPKPDEWPLAGVKARTGKYCAVAWQNRPLLQTLQLKAGQKVTLKLHARAATLPDFVEPKRLGKSTAAHEAVKGIRRGVNLGNCWEAPPGQSWGMRYSTGDIDRIAEQGFDHIRIPVAFHHYLIDPAEGPRLKPELLNDLEPVLRHALERKLHVLVDWHHFDDLTTNPAAHRARFSSVWEAVALHFKSWPQELYLELLNEPKDALTTEVANPIYADAIAAIRKVDPQRIILVSPGKWGDIRELDHLRLPDNDDRLIVTVHCYEPFIFTHQDANWVNFKGLRGITYPGPPATPFVIPEGFRENDGVRSFVEGYNTLPTDRNPCSANTVRELLDLAREWSDTFGRPVHLGEFGSHVAADPASRIRYTRDVRTLAEARGLPWALWDWKAGFRYWDEEKKVPLLRAALFE